MNDEARILFVDTNLFLQCRAFHTLPWSDVADGASEILVIVPRTVQNEVDRLKQDGKSRRAQRAREAASKFRDMVRSTENELRFTGGKVTVVMRPAGPRSKDVKRHDELDLDHPDDRIIDEALAWAEANERPVAVLTGDGGMMQTARHVGLPFVEIPESWLLEPEPDERDKKIKALEKQVEVLSNTYPKIEAAFLKDGEKIDRLEVTVVRYGVPNPTTVASALEELRARHPEVREFGRPTGRPHDLGIPSIATQWRPPSDESIRRYASEEFPAWVDKCERMLWSVQKTPEYIARISVADLVFSNEGTKPAESCRVDMSARGGVLLYSDAREFLESAENILPHPPQPPRGHWSSTFDIMRRGIGLSEAFATPVPHDLMPLAPRTRDPHSFYWEAGRNDKSANWELICAQFRHKTGAITWDVPIWIPEENPERGALDLVISAANLPEPFRLTLPIQITYEDGDTNELVWRLARSI